MHDNFRVAVNGAIFRRSTVYSGEPSRYRDNGVAKKEANRKSVCGAAQGAIDTRSIHFLGRSTLSSACNGTHSPQPEERRDHRGWAVSSDISGGGHGRMGGGSAFFRESAKLTEAAFGAFRTLLPEITVGLGLAHSESDKISEERRRKR